MAHGVDSLNVAAAAAVAAYALGPLAPQGGPKSADLVAGSPDPALEGSWTSAGTKIRLKPRARSRRIRRSPSRRLPAPAGPPDFRPLVAPPVAAGLVAPSPQPASPCPARTVRAAAAVRDSPARHPGRLISRRRLLLPPVPPAGRVWRPAPPGPADGAAAASAPRAAWTSAPNRRPAPSRARDIDGWDLTDLLIHLLESGASDLHLTAGCAARPFRRTATSCRWRATPSSPPPVIQRMLYAILTQKQREKFEEVLELDFAYAVPGKARFRVNIYRQRDAVGAAFRLIPFEIKKLEDLGVPPSVANFAMLPRGFVLVTGPTGSGKSTTLASLVDLANRQPARPHHDRRGPDRVPAHRTRTAWSTSARWGRTRTPSRTPSSTCCARTPTSSWSVRCVTSRRSGSP